MKKSHTITITKENGEVTNVETDMHIDELFKAIQFMRKDFDQIETLEKMGWPVPQR